MANVLITGATGFFGRHICQYIENNLGWNIHVSNTKQANLIQYDNLFVYNDIKFDYIFHLAAYAKAGDFCLYHQAEQFEINQIINSNILKYWSNFQKQAKMIAMGTSCSYDPEILMTEDNYFLGNPEKGLFTYAMTKRMLLVGLKAYAEQYDLKYVYYIPSTLYGPMFDMEDSHFIFDLIKKIHKGKFQNESVMLWGDGHQRRELVYVNDAIEIIFKTLNCENETLNLATGVDYSIREYAEKICDVLEYNKENIFYDTTRYVGVKEKKLDINKVKKFVPDVKFTNIDAGLNNTINYYKLYNETHISKQLV